MIFFRYLLFICALTFLIFGIDKYKSLNAKRRISERDLFVLVALGGGLGAMLAMKIFRHKTIKPSFQRKFWIILFIQCCALIAASRYWYQ